MATLCKNAASQRVSTSRLNICPKLLTFTFTVQQYIESLLNSKTFQTLYFLAEFRFADKLQIMMNHDLSLKKDCL